MENLRIDPTISYDVVELPSKGIYYKNKKKSVRVSYLTATDENILASTTLINNGTLIDEMLKRKVLDRDIEIDELVEEDRQSILIFLRNTAFGTDYKITLTDPKTDKQFEEILDLSTVKVKDFNLVPDSNGEYSYLMNISNKNITFVFINKSQENEIEEIRKNWNGLGAAPIVTKRLEFMIKSVEGNRDPMMIRNFIETLPIKDSKDFRRFVNDNKPGLDLTKTIKTPSGEKIQVELGFGVEFFRPFFGI